MYAETRKGIREIWVYNDQGDVIFRGEAADDTRLAKAALLNSRGFIRTGNWLKTSAYMQATYRVAEAV